MREIVMPKSSMTMTEGEVLRWLVEDGRQVKEGEPIAEIMTDKVDMEVEAPADGRVAILVQAPATVAVGTVIGALLGPGEEPPEASPLEPSTQEPASAVRGVAEPAPGAPEGAVVIDVMERDRVPEEGKVRATPAARAMAKRLGVDIREVTGSGVGGRVRTHDVEAHARPDADRDSADGTIALTAVHTDTLGEARVRRRYRPSGIRGAMARRMALAAQIPQFTLSTEIAMVGADRARRRIEGATLTDVVLRAVAVTLGDHPCLNAYFLDPEIVEYEDVNLGVAVDTKEGLLVPVIQSAQKLGVRQLSVRRRELVEAARLRRLRPEELTGASFTITNLGGFAVDAFQPVVDPPQVAILSVGRSRGDAGRTTTLGIACDHRAVDGAQAARFMTHLKDLLEFPNDVLVGVASDK